MRVPRQGGTSCVVGASGTGRIAGGGLVLFRLNALIASVWEKRPLDKSLGMQVRLVAWYVVALIGGSILFQILFALLGIVNGASGGLAAVMAAMIPGHVYSRRTGRGLIASASAQ